MNTVTQPSNERPSTPPPASGRVATEIGLEAAYAAATADETPGEPLPTTLLRALGVGLFEVTAGSPGLAILSEVLSTMRVLQAFEYDSREAECDAESAQAAAMARLATAFTLLHEEVSQLRQHASGSADELAEDDDDDSDEPQSVTPASDASAEIASAVERTRRRLACTTRRQPAQPAAADEPVASKMRNLIGWVAHNVEAVTEGDVATYESNALRSQVLELLALANDVEVLEQAAVEGEV